MMEILHWALAALVVFAILDFTWVASGLIGVRE